MINAYLKGTNRCNVGCSHCYLPEAVRANGARMSMDTVRLTASFLADMQARGRHAGTHVSWHGGEPLVLSPSFYFEAGAILDAALPGHTESLQTSLIPYRAEFAPFVRERCNSRIGSSVDFSQRRLDGSVDAYHALWMRKVDLARSHGFAVTPGVVPTRAEIGREGYMVDWLAERGFASFNVERFNAYALSFPDRPSNREHALMLSALYGSLVDRLDRTGTTPVVRAVMAGIAGVLHGVGGDRWGGSCMSDFVVVEPDGSLNNCPDKATVDAPYGNVANGFQAFAVDRFRRKSIRHQALGHKKSYCMGCENAHFCGSGCPITPNGPEEDMAEVECSGYKTFLGHLRREAADPGRRALMDAYLALGHAAATQAEPGGVAAQSCAA